MGQQKVNRLQGQIRDMKLAIDPVNAQAEAEKLRIRAQGSEREATLKRSCRPELENALLECRREVNATCAQVDDTLFLDVGQLNDQERELSEIQRATTEYQRAIQEQMEDIQLAIDRVNAQAEAEKLRIRAQGSEREATLKRNSKDSKRDLENALEECRREVNATCDKVDDT